jgi:hypothetical protein
VRKTFQTIAAILLFILLPGVASGDISVSLKLDRSEATLVDSVRLTVGVSGTRNSAAKPILNALDDFTVTPSTTSSRLQIVNGQVDSGVDYTYFLQPKKTGTFQIGPAEVTIEGKTYRSNREILTVVESTQSADSDPGPLFLDASISSAKSYVEEEVVYTLKLYRRARVSDISLNLPGAEYLSFKQLGKPVEYQSVHNGRTYQVLEVRYGLIVSKEGDYSIEPSRMNLKLFLPKSHSPRSPLEERFFKDPFFSITTGRPMTVASEPLKLKVIPLPTEGKPSDFSGLVGSFQIESRLEPATVKAGESATLTVFLQGRGNVNRMPDLKVPELDRIKLYADQPTLTIEPDARGLAGTKTMKWALVPEEEGLYEIPQLQVSFFEPKHRQYKEIETLPHSLTVVPGEDKAIQLSLVGPANGGSTGVVKQEIKEIARDILPIHTSVRDLEAAHSALPGRFTSFLIVLTPLFLYAAAFLGIRLRRKSVATSAATKAKRASKAFLKQYRRGGLSWSELAELIRHYLNDRFGLSLGSVTAEEAAAILTSNGVSSDATERFRTIFQQLEDAVFTGKGQEPCGTEEKLSELIRQIEKEAR